MTNVEIAETLEQVAEILEFKGENPFRVRAYRNAAHTVTDLPRSLAEVVRDPNAKLTDVPGIGKDLAEKIAALVETGSLPLLEQLRAEVPEGVLAMLRIPGLGPKRAAIIFHELNVRSLAELRVACENQQVRKLKGFGAKTEASILQGMDIAEQHGTRLLWAEADEQARQFLAYLRSGPAVERAEAAGSYRRGRDTVGDLDFLVVSTEPGAVMEHVASYSGLAEVIARGETKFSFRLRNRFQVDVRVVPAEAFGAAWQYFTGSQAHNVRLRGLAVKQKLKINEYGVFSNEKRVAGRSEEEVYQAVGLPWIPPELREDRQEFDWAAAGSLPTLVALEDLQGDLHMHSTWTDGLASIEEMASAAAGRGLKYIAITDHSKRAAMVGGLDADKLRRQWDEIDRMAGKLPIVVLKGVEVDILEQGGLDLDDDVLAGADWVVASVHFGQNQSSEQITARVVGALANPYVCAVAHPTGRLLLRRKPYEIDMEAVMRAAATHGKCLELNAHPSRLDLDDVACSAAKAHGVPIVISTDAHSIDGLAAMRYGVQQARRGALTAADVANTQSWQQLRKRIGQT